MLLKPYFQGVNLI